ncbi:MAG TPA: glycoside hydrolase family 20 zincin-like fold domain-containing protein [Balneolaceae bacterium]|nr:glycoside hydrolase family 20 zincin-like fold domain-containing protein [Balneolaceae bacterium]
MKRFINITLGASFCILLFFNLNSCQKEKNPKQKGGKLLPAPQKMKMQKGVSLKPSQLKTIYLYEKAGKNDHFAATLLQHQMRKLFGNNLNVQVIHTYNNLSYPSVVLGIPSVDQKFSKFYSSLNIPDPKQNNKQSYVLNVSKKLVTISGDAHSGLFYGVQTFEQLLENAKWNDRPLQGQLIQDWPDLKKRWVQFDETFHLNRYAYLKNAIAKLARYKVNGVVFEFQDKFNYKKYPVIAAPHSMSPQQVKKLTLYAHKYHVAIIPLVQGLGHAYKYLKHPKFKNLRADPDSPWAFNPLKKGTYKLQFDLYRETMKATPGVKYYHVGGDEVRFTGNNSQLQSYKKKHGPFSLYLRWLNKVYGYVNNKKGRKMIFWDDMPLKIAGIWHLMYPTKMSSQKFDSTLNQGLAKLDKVINKFPRNAIYSQWTYANTSKGNVRKANARLIDWFKKHGIKDLSATAAQNSRPLIPSYERKPANIKSFVTLSAKKHVFGELCTAWDDSGLQFETFWMGYLASADYGWNYKQPATIRQYWNNYIYRFFGPNTSGLYKAFHNLSKRVDFWDTAIMKKGTKRSYRKGKNQLIDLPSIQNVPKEGSWSAHYQALMKKAKQEMKKNARAVETLKKNMGKVKRNRYNLEVFASMGRFMKANANLVFSIGKIAHLADKARKAKKQNQSKKVAANLNKMASIVDSAWQNYKTSYDHLKKVWQVSRFPKGGKGYVPYKFGHFASRRTDLSYLIMAEEGLNLPGYAKELRKEAAKFKK